MKQNQMPAYMKMSWTKQNADTHENKFLWYMLQQQCKSKRLKKALNWTS